MVGEALPALTILEGFSEMVDGCRLEGFFTFVMGCVD
jgi:hypothetical protein